MPAPVPPVLAWPPKPDRAKEAGGAEAGCPRELQATGRHAAGSGDAERGWQRHELRNEADAVTGRRAARSCGRLARLLPGRLSSEARNEPTLPTGKGDFTQLFVMRA